MLRRLLRETLEPLIDLAYSEHMEVQRDAACVIATLSFSDANKEVIVSAGGLTPLLTLAASPDLSVSR